MGIELPGELADVAAKAGVRWPEADEEAMRQAAGAWRAAGAELKEVTAEADGVVGRALDGVRGAAGDAARGHWDSFVRPESGHLTATSASCVAAAERLEHAADQIGAAKVEIVRNLVGLAKNTDVAELAASAGDPTALAELGDLRRATAGAVAGVHETLTDAVRQGTGVTVPDTSEAVGRTLLHPELPLGGSADGRDGLLGQAAGAPGRVLGGPEGVGAGPAGDVPGHSGGPAGVVPGLLGDVAEAPGQAPGRQDGAPAGGHDVVDRLDGTVGSVVAGPPGQDIGPRGENPVDIGPDAGHSAGQDAPGWSVAEGHTGPVRISPRPDDTGPIALGPDGTPQPPPGGTVEQSAAVLDAPPNRPAFGPPEAGVGQSGPSGGGSAPGGNLGGAVGSGAGGASAVPGPRADVGRADVSRADVVREQRPPARPVPVDPVPDSRQDAARQESGRRDGIRYDAARQDAARQDAARQDAARQDAVRQEPARQDGGRTDAAVQRGRGQQQSVIALFLVHMFPIGHLPVPVNRPARQLPAPPPEVDYAAGIRFPVGDHPESGAVHDTGALANARSATPATTTPGEPAEPDDPRRATLLEGHDPLGGVHERDWERRFQVRPARPRTAEPPEYAWPPAELFPEGGTDAGEPVLLPPGIELDRFGTPEGRVLAEAGARYPDRSLPPSHAEDGYRRYRVTEPLPVWRALSAAWFGQPGGAVRYRVGYPVTDLVALGYLADITHQEAQ